MERTPFSLDAPAIDPPVCPTGGTCRGVPLHQCMPPAFTLDHAVPVDRCDHAAVDHALTTPDRVRLPRDGRRGRRGRPAGVPVTRRGGRPPQRPRARTAPQPREASRPHPQRLESLGVGVGEVAHDFNMLLAAILGYTDLALAEVPPHSRLWQNLHRVLSTGRRAQDLVRQLLTWSDPHPQEHTPIPLHEVIAETVTLLRVSLPPTIVLQSHITPEAGVIRADATQIAQVVLNLCTNAVDAMREQGGSLEVVWEAVEGTASGAVAARERVRGPHARLTVRDTGPGIAPAILTRIFEPFFTTKAAGAGTGMGLAIVQRIVASHEGVIRVASTVGQGTTVAIDLPRIERECIRDARVETPRSTRHARRLGVEAAAPLTSLGQPVLVGLDPAMTA